MDRWKQTPCGMIVMGLSDGKMAVDLTGRKYRRVRGTKKFVNLDGTPIKHNKVMEILGGRR